MRFISTGMRALAALIGLSMLMAVDGPRGDEPASGEESSKRFHGRSDRCGECHEAGPDSGVPGDPKPSVEVCSSCHEESARNMHMVGMPMGDLTLPVGWPLEDDKIVCVTCHAEPACDPARNQEAPYHRGGPYKDAFEMCWQCHDDEKLARSDPHHPTTVRSNDDSTCNACHTGRPETGASAADSHLRLEGQKVCTNCHDEPEHAGSASHLGKLVETPPGGEIALDVDGTITCWTCHEVHGDNANSKEINREDAAIALRSHALSTDWKGQVSPEATWPGDEVKDPKHPSLLALPLQDGQLCRACHGNGP